MLRGGTSPLDARGLLRGDALRYLEDAERFIVLPPSEVADVGAPIQPHWDPSLARPGKARREFVGRLQDVGLIAFRRTARCHIGAFFVKKKLDQIRLVLDCRPVNQLHRKPPKSRLATPGALANLNFSTQWQDLSSEAFPEVVTAGDVDLHVS